MIEMNLPYVQVQIDSLVTSEYFVHMISRLINKLYFKRVFLTCKRTFWVIWVKSHH